MVLVISSIAVLFPPIAPVISGIFFAITVGWTLHVFTTKIGIEDDKLIMYRIWNTTQVSLDKVTELKRMKVVGTVANSPMYVRSFTVVTDENELTLSTSLFPLNDILELLDDINQRIKAPKK